MEQVHAEDDVIVRLILLTKDAIVLKLDDYKRNFARLLSFSHPQSPVDDAMAY